MPPWAQDSFILEASGPASVLKQNESMLRVKADHFLKGCRGSSVMPTWPKIASSWRPPVRPAFQSKMGLR